MEPLREGIRHRRERREGQGPGVLSSLRQEPGKRPPPRSFHGYRPMDAAVNRALTTLTPGIADQAMIFVLHLKIIVILPATRSTDDLFKGSLSLTLSFPVSHFPITETRHAHCDRQISLRSSTACANVPLSTCSNSPPTGNPRAIRVTFTSLSCSSSPI